MKISDTGLVCPALSTAINRTRHVLLLTVLTILSACAGGPPGGLQVVSDFDISRYEGRWYEIARLDHRFERGLSQVTADYAVQPDNTVRVVNRGFNTQTQSWEEAVGRARFADSADSGALEVSFFGPFYGGYNIVELDKTGYQWALVTGPSFNYLWILSRQPRMDTNVYERLIKTAGDAGFDISGLIVVEH